MTSQASSSRTASPQSLFDHVQFPRIVKISVDFESSTGTFGWITIKHCCLPFIIRIVNGERLRFVSIKMAEFQLLRTYFNCLHPDMYTDSPVKSYFMTETETTLFNNINNNHSDCKYNIGQLIANTDLIARLEDVQKFYTFLEVCYGKLQRQVTPDHNKLCGFIRIDSESVVPYCVKDEQKYIPLFCFEGQIEDLRNRVVKLDNWYWAYLKFCCKVLCIRNDLYAMKNSCDGINFEDIKEYYPPETNFEVVWPAIGNDTLIKFTTHQNTSQIYPPAWFKYPTTLVNEVSVSENICPAPLVSSSPTVSVKYIELLPHQLRLNSINCIGYGRDYGPVVQESRSLTPVFGDRRARQQQHQFNSIDSLTQPTSSTNQVIIITCGNVGWELTKIPEHPWFRESSRFAYKTMYVEFQGQTINCINARPFMFTYTYSFMFVPLKNLVDVFMPSCSIPKCAYLLNKRLKIKLYSPNSSQLAVLREMYYHEIMYAENTPLAVLSDLSQVMVQLKMLVAETQAEWDQATSEHAKRPRMDFNIGWAEHSRSQLNSPISVTTSAMNYRARNADYKGRPNTSALSQSPQLMRPHYQKTSNCFPRPPM